ncbi:hypothetical protein FISHEDRAFT_58921 [Fistulina hepatica ATCC 64428]|uniref:Uncharacterized protein n=1 Tax=Fistulina hepatica ATCC 64428 TaxID=1128425 RepID=A0A0D7ADE4_9AGAR|nr:hypothetical protein FISHEDRAFT_58921 [Fistulina hepatica ATCC 64428]
MPSVVRFIVDAFDSSRADQWMYHRIRRREHAAALHLQHLPSQSIYTVAGDAATYHGNDNNNTELTKRQRRLPMDVRHIVVIAILYPASIVYWYSSQLLSSQALGLRLQRPSRFVAPSDRRKRKFDTCGLRARQSTRLCRNPIQSEILGAGKMRRRGDAAALPTSQTMHCSDVYGDSRPFDTVYVVFLHAPRRYIQMGNPLDLQTATDIEIDRFPSFGLIMRTPASGWTSKALQPDDLDETREMKMKVTGSRRQEDGGQIIGDAASASCRSHAAAFEKVVVGAYA